MEHLRELITRHRPGLSDRKIEIDHGLSDGLIAYYFKPASNVTRVPRVETLDRIAAALGCTRQEVFDAFALDLGYTEAAR